MISFLANQIMLKKSTIIKSLHLELRKEIANRVRGLVFVKISKTNGDANIMLKNTVNK